MVKFRHFIKISVLPTGLISYFLIHFIYKSIFVHFCISKPVLFEQEDLQLHNKLTATDHSWTHNRGPAFLENNDMYLYLCFGHCGNAQIQWICNQTPTACWIIQTQRETSLLPLSWRGNRCRPNDCDTAMCLKANRYCEIKKPTHFYFSRTRPFATNNCLFYTMN